MIPFYNLKNIHENINNELLAAAKKVIESGDYVFGTDKFEEEFADYTGAKYCIAVSNGTSALHLSLLSLGIGPGDDVITVGHTFRATAAAIKYCGANPVYIDIDRETYTLDVSQLEKNITDRTKCIIPVHIYGNCAPINEILSISKKYNIPVIEDCSQAHGTTLNTKHVGTFGNLGTFSFYPGKGLGALGDSGCIITNDEYLRDYLKTARSWNDNEVGFNYRMANIQAEFLRIKLKSFNEILRTKRSIAQEYDKIFSFAKTKNNVEHSFHVYPILVKNREKLISDLKNILQLKSHYSIPVHRLDAYRSSFDLPVTDLVSKHQLSLPIYPGVEYKSVIQIISDYQNDNPCTIF